MGLNILEIKPTVISRDLRGKYVCLYGLPKSGKTTLATQFPNVLLVAFEKGYNAISGVRPADIKKWKDFKDVVKQLDTPEAKKVYETIIIDTVSIAWDMCTEYICHREGVDKIGEIPFGGGYDMVKKEFEKTFRELMNDNSYGLVFIAHSATRLEQQADGNTVEILAPDIPKRCYEIVNRMVDIIGYIGVDGSGERYLYTRKTPTIMAGSRFRFLAPKILLGYTELVDAISTAIDEEAQNGATVVDKVDKAPAIDDNAMSFKEVIGEVKKIVLALSSADAKLTEPVHMDYYKKVVEKYLGKGKLVKDCGEEQQDFLELILSDLTTYVNNNNITL